MKYKPPLPYVLTMHENAADQNFTRKQVWSLRKWKKLKSTAEREHDAQRALRKSFSFFFNGWRPGNRNAETTNRSKGRRQKIRTPRQMGSLSFVCHFPVGLCIWKHATFDEGRSRCSFIDIQISNRNKVNLHNCTCCLVGLVLAVTAGMIPNQRQRKGFINKYLLYPTVLGTYLPSFNWLKHLKISEA